jgi:putative membrane protein
VHVTTDAWLAIAHHLAVFTLLAAVAAEWALLRPGIGRFEVERLARIDAVYGISALAVILAGVARVVWGVSPADFYLENPVFWLKVGGFAAVGLLSVVPTIQYLRWRRLPAGFPASEEVTNVRRVIAVELLVFPVIPICAALMARGIGH